MDELEKLQAANHLFDKAFKSMVNHKSEGVVVTIKVVRKFPPVLFKHIKSLRLNAYAYHALQYGDIKYIGELVQRTPAKLQRLRQMGRKSLREIEQKLESRRLMLGMELVKFPTRAELDAAS